MANVYKPPMQAKYSASAPVYTEPVSRLVAVVYSGSRTSAGTSTLYTCPSGKKARVTFWSMSINGSTTQSQFKIAGTTLFVIEATTPNNAFYPQFVGYNEAPQLQAGQTIQLTTTAGFGGGVTLSVIVIEEDLSFASSNAPPISQ